MGWFRDLLMGSQEPDSTMIAGQPDAQFEVVVPPEMLEAMTQDGAIAPRISRAMALQVPAVLRSRNLIAGTLASLPHVVHGPDRKEVPQTYLLGGPGIDPDMPNSVVLAQTYEDLLFESIAWWRVTAFGWHGYPTNATHLDVHSVYVSNGVVYVNGVPVPDRELIRFDSPNPALLKHAARAIRTCLSLERSSERYSKEPLPLGYFTPKEGVDVGTHEEVQDVLDTWERSRQERAWGYVGAALDPHAMQWSPEQIQLADSRQHAVLEIARAAGVDPERLGVSTTSRTYKNAEHERIDLLDFTLGAYVTLMQERLSMRDVLPRGYMARVKFAGFLRSDASTRMSTYKVGLEVGAYTVDEIRELEDKPALTPDERRRVEQSADRSAGAVTQESEMSARFDADELAIVTFDDDEVYASFSVDIEKRTISGMLVPWGKVARSGFSKWKFREGSLRWSTPSRVKLNLHHDRSQIVAFAQRIRATSQGLDGTFKVGSDDDSTKALLKAKEGLLDGFSIEVEFEDQDDWQVDPTDESVRLVNSARLTGAALTGTPAFDDARVAAVAAEKENVNGHAGRNGGRSGGRNADPAAVREGASQERGGRRGRVRVRFRPVR